MEDIKISIPLCKQYDKAHDKSWAYRMCAPCSLWMLLKHHDSEFSHTPLDLRDQLITRNGYIENIGFKHQAMAELGQHYGLPLTYARKFFYTPKEKEDGTVLINSNLRAGNPVIASVFYLFNPAKGGHMVIIHGLQEFSGQTIGYHIQDPDSQYKGHNYFLTKQEFVDGWRGGLIYEDKSAK